MEEYYMEYEEITFNDIPRAMANILRKCDLLEQSIDVLREEIRQTNKRVSPKSRLQSLLSFSVLCTQFG